MTIKQLLEGIDNLIIREDSAASLKAWKSRQRGKKKGTQKTRRRGGIDKNSLKQQEKDQIKKVAKLQKMEDRYSDIRFSARTSKREHEFYRKEMKALHLAVKAEKELQKTRDTLKKYFPTREDKADQKYHEEDQAQKQAAVDKLDWSNHKNIKSKQGTVFTVPKKPINVSKLNGKAAKFYIKMKDERGISAPHILVFNKLSNASLKDKTYRKIRSKLSPIKAKHFMSGERSDGYVDMQEWVEENLHHFEPTFSFGHGASTSDVLEDVINTLYDVTGIDFENAPPEPFSDWADDTAQQYDMDHEEPLEDEDY